MATKRKKSGASKRAATGKRSKVLKDLDAKRVAGGVKGGGRAKGALKAAESMDDYIKM